MNVDTLSQTSLIGHLNKYPKLFIRRDRRQRLGIDRQRKYTRYPKLHNNFPQGLHIKEAKDILNAVVEWNNVKNTNDIFVINDYIHTNPTSPFKQQASILIAGLKQGEINEMRNNPNRYDVSRLMRLLNDGIATERELILAKVMTETILETLKNTDIGADLPNIRKLLMILKLNVKMGIRMSSSLVFLQQGKPVF